MGFKLMLVLIVVFGFLDDYKAQDKKAVAVLELYTSQGCSSCPPADENLSQVLKESEQRELPVYILSFHVDYWDRLGWKDTFSKEVYTERQRKYAQVFRTKSIYTPQLIVNGSEQFVGSNETKTKLAIENALRTSSTVGISLNKKNAENDLVALSIELNGNVDSDLLVNVALVEDGVTTKILRGENRGRTIKYNSIVKKFKTFPAQKELQTQLTIPKTVNRENASIVVYVQQKSNLQVLGASAIDL